MTRNRIGAILAGVGAALMIALALASTSCGMATPVQAQSQVDFDVDPEITGNSASTLGAVESCYHVVCPSAECSWDGTSTFDDVSDYIIDIVVTNDPPGPYAYVTQLNYDQTTVHIADRTATVRSRSVRRTSEPVRGPPATAP
jgi:hypothetical protein